MLKIPKVVFQKKSEEDIDEIVLYIAADNVPAANTFLNAIEDTARMLVAMPEMGSRRYFDSIKDLRMRPIQKFDQYLIFYCPTEGGIEIIRVLHGARDIPELFEK